MATTHPNDITNEISSDGGTGNSSSSSRWSSVGCKMRECSLTCDASLAFCRRKSDASRFTFSSCSFNILHQQQQNKWGKCDRKKTISSTSSTYVFYHIDYFLHFNPFYGNWSNASYAAYRHFIHSLIQRIYIAPPPQETYSVAPSPSEGQPIDLQSHKSKHLSTW